MIKLLAKREDPSLKCSKNGTKAPTNNSQKFKFDTILKIYLLNYLFFWCYKFIYDQKITFIRYKSIFMH